MKKNFFVLFFALCALTSCGKKDSYTHIGHSSLTPSPLSADYIFSLASLADEENHSNVIVKGRFANDAKPDIQYLPDGTVSYGCTISTFKISSVYKGALKSNEEIKVVEPYYIDESKAIHYLGNYYPSDIGREYLMFLDIQPTEFRFAGMYSPCAREYGRYLAEKLENIDLVENEQLNLGNSDSKLYRSIYSSVIDKYINQLQ